MHESVLSYKGNVSGPSNQREPLIKFELKPDKTPKNDESNVLTTAPHRRDTRFTMSTKLVTS